MISSRDRNILIIVAMVIILAGSYWFSGKIGEENLELEKQANDLSTRYLDLVAKNANQNNYKADAEINAVAFENLLAEYRNSLSQEETLLFLNNVEKNTGVWFKQQSIESVAQVYQFGRLTSSNPARFGQRVYNTDNVGISTNTSVSYECSYEQLKTLIEYLNENGKKILINNMSYTYDSAKDIVSGTMSFTHYAIAGSERPKDPINIKDVSVGTNNIFASDLFVPGGSAESYKDKIVTDYDLFLIVNRTGADKDAVICGQALDTTGESAISSNDGGVENVTIKITGTDGNYRVSYQVGTQQYPSGEDYAYGAPFICGKTMDLLIISCERGSNTDTSEVNVNLINDTDLELSVAIINDDEDKPRVNIRDIDGAVTVYDDKK